ncbi:unnamed protein product, partial [Porites evermanni]
SCVQAEPPVNASTRDEFCILYNYTKGELCKGIITSLYVFGNQRTVDYGDFQTLNFQGYFFNFLEISKECRIIMRDLFCRYHFPPCDTSLRIPRPRRICRRSCEYLDHVLCLKEMISVRIAAKTAPGFDHKMINCSFFDVANGGDAPECYQYQPLSGFNSWLSTDCYYDIGVGYSGTVNITRSGRTCQRWASQCPHRHWRIPQDGGQNDSNMCRNPEGSAPDGPWCYTTDPKVRWEYCNISRCPPRVPQEIPRFVRGYPLNSSAVRIYWEKIPPTSYKEKLQGYRIRYKRLGSQTFKELSVTRNVTDAVIDGLLPNTEYQIEVNGFNKVGHGSAGKMSKLKTLSPGFVSTYVTLQLVMQGEFDNVHLNRSSAKLIEKKRWIKTMVMRHFNKTSSLNIYEVSVLRLSRESLKADVKVLAIINSKTDTKAEAINHLIEGIHDALGEQLKDIFLLERPQPPINVKATNVQTSYFILTWDGPRYGKYYQIDNFTIERKKDTSNNFSVVNTLPYTRTGMVVEDLEPSSEYAIRLSSNNRYGRSDGAIIKQTTLPDTFMKKLILVIVLPLSLAVFFVVVICLKFRPIFRAEKPDQIEKTEMLLQGDWVELERSEVKLDEMLGEGAFGEVYKGEVQIGEEKRPCAVKKVKENATTLEKRDLLNELKIMVTVGEHSNVVSLIGACTRNEPILVIVRLAENGCLLSHLRKNRERQYINFKAESAVHFTSVDKITIARDVANGMLHLSNKKCVHRDLAARNVLLGKNNAAMVSDFGLSRDVYESGEYENTSGGMLPVRWMAIESLEDYIYTTQTDVWSFGVVLWEIESGGRKPYSGLGGIEIVDFLKSGKRLQQPDGCSDEM